MKKIFCAMIAAAMFLLTSCGNNDPVASSKAISCTEQAIEIGESYLAGDLSADSAQSKLDSILDDMSYAADYSSEERQADKTKNADAYLEMYIGLLNTYIGHDDLLSTADSYDSVQDAIDDLNKWLNKYN